MPPASDNYWGNKLLTRFLSSSMLPETLNLFLLLLQKCQHWEVPSPSWCQVHLATFKMFKSANQQGGFSPAVQRQLCNNFRMTVGKKKYFSPQSWCLIKFPLSSFICFVLIRWTGQQFFNLSHTKNNTLIKTNII